MQAVMIRPVATEPDVERLRIVRNACRWYMTRDREEITAEQQAHWWRQLDKEVVNPCLLWTSDEWIGYGLIRLEQHRAWLSGGLLPNWRGRGHGRCLFRELIQLAASECWLEVREDNLPAMTLYKSLGFHAVAQAGIVVTMKL